jgi:TolA-binding protein
MKENVDIIITILGALGIRELLAYVIKWIKENSDLTKTSKITQLEALSKEIEDLQNKVEVMQIQLHQTQQRNVKLETSITLSLQFIERSIPESRDIVKDIKALLNT